MSFYLFLSFMSVSLLLKVTISVKGLIYGTSEFDVVELCVWNACLP